jgi:hypothetical protein
MISSASSDIIQELQDLDQGVELLDIRGSRTWSSSKFCPVQEEVSEVFVTLSLDHNFVWNLFAKFQPPHAGKWVAAVGTISCTSCSRCSPLLAVSPHRRRPLWPACCPHPTIPRPHLSRSSLPTVCLCCSHCLLSSLPIEKKPPCWLQPRSQTPHVTQSS